MSPACTSCRCALCTCSTAVCSTRRNAAVCSGSRSCAALQLLDRLVEVGVEVAAQPRQIGAAGGEDPLAVGVVRERVEQVLEREVGVPARDGFAVRDGAGRLRRRRKTRSAHASSMVARSGNSASRASDVDRVDFGFGDFPGIDAGDAAAVQVHLHHDPVRLGRRLLEHRLEHVRRRTPSSCSRR